MISLIRIRVTGPTSLHLSFSDGSSGEWSAERILGKNTVLTRPLEDPAYFARAFIEGDALAWPNGLEFSAISLHRRLDESGALVKQAA